MKIKSMFIQVALLGVALTCGTTLRANNSPAAQTLGGGNAGNSFQMVAFGDTAEAKMLRDVPASP